MDSMLFWFGAPEIVVLPSRGLHQGIVLIPDDHTSLLEGLWELFLP